MSASEAAVVNDDDKKKEDEVVEKEEIDERYVFVPGFKGSKLVDEKTREVIWLTGWGVFSVPPLALPGERTLQLEGFHCHKGPLVADGPLESLFGGLYQVYNPFLKFAKKTWGDRFSTFAYDWRQDNGLIARELKDYIIKNFIKDDDKQKKTKTRLNFICHSNGGLVIWALLSQLAAVHGTDGCTETDGKVISLMQNAHILFEGTPFLPIEPLLADITPGTAGHYWFLPSDVLCTFPSLFELMLPERAQCDPLMYDVDFWIKRSIGVFNTAGMQPELVTEFKAIVRDMMEMADNFRSKVLRADFAGTPFEGLPIGIICSKTRPTPNGLPASLFDATIPLDWTTFKMEPGDGRVPYSSATSPPSGLTLDGIFHSAKEHGSLLEDAQLLLEALSTIGKPKSTTTATTTSTTDS